MKGKGAGDVCPACHRGPEPEGWLMPETRTNLRLRWNQFVDGTATLVLFAALGAVHVWVDRGLHWMLEGAPAVVLNASGAFFTAVVYLVQFKLGLDFLRVFVGNPFQRRKEPVVDHQRSQKARDKGRSS